MRKSDRLVATRQTLLGVYNDQLSWLRTFFILGWILVLLLSAGNMVELTKVILKNLFLALSLLCVHVCPLGSFWCLLLGGVGPDGCISGGASFCFGEAFLGLAGAEDDVEKEAANDCADMVESRLVGGGDEKQISQTLFESRIRTQGKRGFVSHP